MDRMDSEKRGADESNMDRADAKENKGSCSCGKEEAEHTRHKAHLDGPNLPESKESANKGQDEGKMYDV